MSYFCGRCNEFDEQNDIRSHRCSPRKAAPNKISAPNSAPNAVPNKVVKSGSRSAQWKVANPEKYRAYQRDLMRKRRSKTGSGLTNSTPAQ